MHKIFHISLKKSRTGIQSRLTYNKKICVQYCRNISEQKRNLLRVFKNIALYTTATLKDLLIFLKHAKNITTS